MKKYQEKNIKDIQLFLEEIMKINLYDLLFILELLMQI
jgi:hypothetical protein